MKLKLSFILLCLIALCFSCSSDDDDNEMNPPINLTKGDFSLRLNGENFDNERVELFRDTIDNVTNNRILFSSSDDFGNSMAIWMEPQFEEGTYAIQTFDSESDNIAIFDKAPNTRFGSDNGSITFSEIITDFNTGCQWFSGTYDFNLINNVNNEQLNVSGEFDVTYYSCED